MKKATIIPAILTLVLCVGVLCVGVFSAVPTSSTVSGFLSIGAFKSNIAISAYRHNSSGEMESEPFFTSADIGKGDIIDFGELTFKVKNDDGSIKDLSQVTNKITIRLTNTSGERYGAYFSTAIVRGAATALDVKTTKELTTLSSKTDVVGATMTGYKELANSSTIDMEITFSLINFVKGAYQTVDLSSDINKIYLNVETFNEKLEEKEQIKDDAYYEALGYLVIGKGLGEIDTNARLEISQAVSEGKDISKIKVSNSVKHIGSYMFYDEGGMGPGVNYSSSAFKEIILPDGLIGIGREAFRNCSGLGSITIPSSVTNINGSAFSGCSSLSFEEYGNAKYLGNNENPYLVLYKAINMGITTATIHTNTKVIADSAFSGCNSLSFEEYGNAKYLGNNENPYLYLYKAINTSITTVTIHVNTKFLAEDAFSGCSILKSITIPSSVTSINNNAFINCNNLATITVKKGTATIFICALPYNYTLNETTDCPEGTAIARSASVDNVYTLVVEEEGTNIDAEYISNGYLITGVDEQELTLEQLEATLEEAGEVAGLIKIKVAEGVTSIGVIFNEHQSSSDIRISEIVLPNSVTSISNTALTGCSDLISITISSGVESIDFGVFEGCYSLENIVVDENNKIYTSANGANAIIEIESNTLIAGCKNTVIPDTVIAIGNNAFYGCYIENMDIPYGVESIGSYAFTECWYLQNIELPESVTTIGEGAFAFCSSLNSIVINGSVEKNRRTYIL